MKKFKWIAWAIVAAGFLYAGRERLAAQRLEQRATPPAPGAPAPLIPDPWLDAALGTPPDADSRAPYASGRIAPAPVAGGAHDAPTTPQPFHWLDVQSNPSIVHEGVGGKARAKHGAGVLIDSSKRRWEIEPRRSTATSAGAVSAAPDAEVSVAAPAPPADPAEIARRKDASLLALKCAGAAAAALLLW